MKEELVEGIRQAISKGEPIEKAMMSFYSAGYPKQDIEEAAAMAQRPGFFQQAQQQPRQQMPMPQMQVQPQTPPQQEKKPMQQMAVPRLQFQYQPQQPIQPGVVQRVSAYGQKQSGPPSKTGMAITIVLVIILLFLIGMLAAVILFKDELSNFLSSIWAVLR